jgi:hypothetical protein
MVRLKKTASSVAYKIDLTVRLSGTMLHFMAIKPGHSESQSCISGSSLSARSGRTRPCSVRNLQPARRLLSASTSQAGTQTASARGTCCAQETPSGWTLQTTPRRSAARLRSSPRTWFSAWSSRTAPRASLAPTAPSHSAGRNLRPAQTEFSAHSVQGPALPHPRRPPLPGSRTAQSDCSTPPSSPGNLPSRDLLICVGTHASAHAPDSALVRADLRTRERRARAI